MPLVAHCARLCNLLIQECRYSEDISCFGCHALRGFEEVPGCSVSSSGGCRGERAFANQLARQCDAFTPSQLEDTKLPCHFFLNLVLTYGLIPTGSRFSCSSEANLLFELRRSPPYVPIVKLSSDTNLSKDAAGHPWQPWCINRMSYARTMDLFCFPKLVDPAETFLCCLPLGVGVKLLMWPHQALTLYTVAAALSPAKSSEAQHGSSNCSLGASLPPGRGEPHRWRHGSCSLCGPVSEGCKNGTWHLDPRCTGASGTSQMFETIWCRPKQLKFVP